MAEGFFKKHALGGYDGISAGTRPVSKINPVVIEVMKEASMRLFRIRLTIPPAMLIKFLLRSS
jgi:protein-tyrosine-phosphatase